VSQKAFQIINHYYFAKLAVSWVCIIVVTLLCATGVGAKVFELEKQDIGYQSLAPYTYVFRDPTGQVSFSDLQSTPDRFELLQTKYIDMKQTRGRYWVRFELKNTSPQQSTWRLDFRRPYLLEAKVYVESGKSIKVVLDLPENASFNQRHLKTRYIGTNITIPAGEKATVYIGYKSLATAWLPVHIGAAASVENAYITETTINWLINGLLFAMVIFAFVMGPVLTWRVSSAYIFYAASGVLFILHADGYTKQYIWPSWKNDPDFINLFLGLLVTLSALIFARILFDTNKNQPGMDKVYLSTGVLLVLVLSVSSFAYGQIWFNAPAYIIILLTSFLHPIIGFRALMQKQTGAIPFLIGSPLIAGSLIFSAIAHIFPGRFSIENTLNVGHITLLVEAFVFAVAVVMRVLGLREERDRALRSELAEAQKRIELDSALRESEKRYNETRELAQRHQAKLSTYGHDLRQPLVSLRTALARIEGKDETSKLQMHQAFDYLESLANEQIDLGETHAPRDDGKEVFSLSDVLDSSVKMFKNEAMEKGLELEYQSSQLEVNVNPIALMRIVNNLLSNAINHTETGKITVSCKSETGQAFIVISDTGPGIKKENIQTLLQSGNKGKNSKGLGLGLDIVRNLAKEQDIDFSIEPNDSKGMQAILKLPR